MIATEPNMEHFSTNIRYHLAKKQMEGLFLKWVSQPNTTELIQKLIIDVQKSPSQIIVLF